MFSFNNFVYRREPELFCKSVCGSKSLLSYGMSSTQGWRRSQEDRFKVVENFSKDYSYFAVFDGHGGSEVAVYLKRQLHQYILGFLDILDDDVQLALKLSFMSCDMSILETQTIEELNAIIAKKDNEVNGSELRQRILQHLAGLLNRHEHEIPDDMGENQDLDKPGGSNVEENAIQNKGDIKAEKSGKLTVSEEDLEAKEPYCEYIEGVAGPSKEIKEEKNSESKIFLRARNEEGGSNVEENAIQHKGDIKAEKSGKLTVSEEHLEAKEPYCEYIEGVAGPSMEIKERKNCDESKNFLRARNEEDSENLPADLHEIVSDKSESDDDEEEEEEDESSRFQVLKYLMDDVLEASDPEDESYDSEDEKSGSDTDNEDEDITIGNEASSGRKDFEMEAGVQSGSTGTVVIINQHKIYIANVGDTRCVLSRNGRAYHISVDHTPENEEEKIRILEAGAKVEDGRINDGLNLSRAFGDFMYKRNANLDVADQAVSIIPHVAEINIERDVEFVIIASDGIWNSMTSQEVVDYVHLRLKASDATLKDICEELFYFILPEKVTSDGTGCDNMTCIIMKINYKSDEPNAPVPIANYKSVAQAPSVSVSETNRKKVHGCQMPSHSCVVDPYGPSTSRGTVIQMAGNQSDFSYDDDDDDECQIIFERVNPYPQVFPVDRELLQKSFFDWPIEALAEHFMFYKNCPEFMDAYSIAQNVLLYANESDEDTEMEEILNEVDDTDSVNLQPFEKGESKKESGMVDDDEKGNDTFKQADVKDAADIKDLLKNSSGQEDEGEDKGSDSVLRDEDNKNYEPAAFGKELLKNTCKQGDKDVQGKGSESILKDENIGNEATESYLEHAKENPVTKETGNDKEPFTDHIKPSVEKEYETASIIDSELAPTPELAKPVKRPMEEENEDNLKKSKYM